MRLPHHDCTFARVDIPSVRAQLLRGDGFSSQWYPIWSPFYMMALSLPCCSLQPVSLWPICQRGMFVSSFGSAVAAWFGSVALRFLRGLSTLSLLAGGDVHFKACQSPPHLIFHVDWTRCQLCIFLLNPLNPKP